MIDTKRLRQKILDLAIRGKLVPQDPADEPASVLLERIHQEKLQMVADGKLKKKDIVNDSVIYLGDGSLHYEKVGDNEPVCIEDELPFELPGGWSWARMGAFEKLSNGTSKRHGKDGCETIVLRLADLTEHAISLEDTRRIILTETEREKYRLNPNDIVFIRVNGSKEKVGKAFVVPKSDDDVAYCDHLMRGEPSGALSSDLLCFFLSTAYLHNRIKENVVSAAGQNTISQGSLVSLLIPIPPLAEQQRIVTALDDLLACVDTIEREQAELDELLAKTRSTSPSAASSCHRIRQTSPHRSSLNAYTRKSSRWWPTASSRRRT